MMENFWDRFKKEWHVAEFREENAVRRAWRGRRRGRRNSGGEKAPAGGG